MAVDGAYRALRADLRHSGIDVVGDMPRATHFGLFFKTRQDLIDALVPYFKAGLENSEFCMRVIAEPLGVAEARASMAGVLPDFDAYLEKGQIEIAPYTEWYMTDGAFDPDRVPGDHTKGARFVVMLPTI